MLQRQLNTLESRQRQRRINRITNLTTIHIILRKHLQHLLDVELPLISRQRAETASPDLLADFDGRGRVLDGEVDAGLHSGVKIFDAVGGEKDDAGEVFEGAQEGGDEGVALGAGVFAGGARFEKDVGFVDEDHGLVLLALMFMWGGDVGCEATVGRWEAAMSINRRPRSEAGKRH